MNKRTLRGIRNDLGLTQQEMAKKLHMPIASYQRYETCKAIIPADALIEIADMVKIVDVRQIKIK